MARTSPAARLVLWAAVLAVGANAVGSLAATVLRLLQDRQPSIEYELLFRLTDIERVVLTGANVVAEALFAVGLLRMARALGVRGERRLAFVSAGAAAVAAFGFALLWSDDLRFLLLRAHRSFTSGTLFAACIVLESAATGAWLLGSSRLLRSFDLRLPPSLTVSLAAGLAAGTLLDCWFALSRSPGPFLQSSIASWASGEMSLFVSAGTALVAWRVWRASGWIDGAGGPRDVGPYRAPDDPGAAATLQARRDAFDAAQDVRLHTGATLALAAAAVVGVILSAYIAGWHKFYADCAVRQGIGSLSVVALVGMLLSPTTTTGAEGPRRLTYALMVVALVAWGLALVDLDQLIHFMEGNYDATFYPRLEARDALFTRTVNIQTLAQVAVIFAVVSQAATYARAAAAMGEAKLAGRATRLAVLVGVVALAPLAQLALENSDSVDLAALAESFAKSPVAQGFLALAVLSVANFYRVVSGSLAAAFDARVQAKLPHDA